MRCSSRMWYDINVQNLVISGLNLDIINFNNMELRIEIDFCLGGNHWAVA